MENKLGWGTNYDYDGEQKFGIKSLAKDRTPRKKIQRSKVL